MDISKEIEGWKNCLFLVFGVHIDGIRTFVAGQSRANMNLSSPEGTLTEQAPQN